MLPTAARPAPRHLGRRRKHSCCKVVPLLSQRDVCKRQIRGTRPDGLKRTNLAHTWQEHIGLGCMDLELTCLGRMHLGHKNAHRPMLQRSKNHLLLFTSLPSGAEMTASLRLPLPEITAVSYCPTRRTLLCASLTPRQRPTRTRERAQPCCRATTLPWRILKRLQA